MVRNIDYPEALVFYNTLEEDTHSSVFLEDDGETPREGLLDLLQECQDTSTPALYLGPQEPPSSLQPYLQHIPPPMIPRSMAKFLWESIHSLMIQPEGFGGSAGFGRKLADPERPPLPKHVVVFCTDLEVVRAARAVGMRVLALQDNDLADGILDDYYNLYLEDVSTPGSFWLNPPYCRDDDGDKVYIQDILEEDEGVEEEKQEVIENEPDVVIEQDMSDDELQAILNDMDPVS